MQTSKDPAENGQVGESPTIRPDEQAKRERKRLLADRVANLESQLANLQLQRTELLTSFVALPSVSLKISSSTSESSQVPTNSEGLSVSRTPSSPDPEIALAEAHAVIKRHIRLLHDYNEMRDIGMGLMGLIADSRGVRVRDVQEEFGVDKDD